MCYNYKTVYNCLCSCHRDASIPKSDDEQLKGINREQKEEVNKKASQPASKTGPLIEVAKNIIQTARLLKENAKREAEAAKAQQPDIRSRREAKAADIIPVSKAGEYVKGQHLTAKEIEYRTQRSSDAGKYEGQIVAYYSKTNK